MLSLSRGSLGLWCQAARLDESFPVWGACASVGFSPVSGRQDISIKICHAASLTVVKQREQSVTRPPRGVFVDVRRAAVSCPAPSWPQGCVFEALLAVFLCLHRLHRLLPVTTGMTHVTRVSSFHFKRLQCLEDNLKKTIKNILEYIPQQ